MAAIQLNTISLPKEAPLELEEPYSLDVWPIKDWKIYSEAPEAQKTRLEKFGYENDSFVFSSFEPNLLKEEFKYFLSKRITDGTCSLQTILAYYSRGKHLFDYSKEHPEIESIIDIDEASYSRFLVKSKIIKNVRVPDSSRVNVDMEECPVSRKNRTISLIDAIKTELEKYYQKDIPEQQKDYWKLKNFPFPEIKIGCTYKNLDFSQIRQTGIKNTVKNYFYFKLKTIKPNTLYDKLRAIRIFLEWLYDKYPDITNLSSLNRTIIEEYLEYLKLEAGYQSANINRLIIQLKNFLDEGFILYSRDFPKNPLILNTDYRIKPVRNAGFYSDNEIKNINRALRDMPTLYASIVFCLETMALRISDLLTLTPSMIEECTNVGVYKHQIRVEKKVVKKQQKTGEDVEIYITEPIYKILMNMLDESKKKYGEDVKYIFASGKDTHISYSIVQHTINKLFYENNVLSDDGSLLRFKTHKFRATKATKLIEKGFGATEAAKALGHSSLQSLSYYSNITEDTLIDSLAPFLEKAEIYIRNMGKKAPNIAIETDKLLPLCNGWCCRPIGLGLCEHANKCLTCSLFKPDGRHLSYYQLQLQELEATLGAAMTTENQKLIDKTKEDIAAVKRIIKEVEQLCSKET